MDERFDWHLTEGVVHEQGRGDPFAAAVRATRMPMVITDPKRTDNPIVYCNTAFQQLTGYMREEIIGRNCRFLQGEQTDRDAVARVREAIDNGHDIDVELLNYRKDGSAFWNALYLSPVRGDDGSIQFFFASQLDVTERITAAQRIAEQKAIVEREVEARTAELEAALATKTLLLHEVDHRVKNNLMMIGSLLRLQARRIGDQQVARRLLEMLERVDALATVHRQLYQSEDVTRFDIGGFCSTLIADMIGASGSGAITALVDAEPIFVAARDASVLGLVLNEIVTNAIKHAYANGRAGTMRIDAHVVDGEARIVVADDGPGLPGDSPSGGLGSELIARLSRQANAKVVWEDAQPGTRAVISFPSTCR